jgi:RHS repeat-associated protein
VREYRWDQQNRLVRFLEGTHESVYEYDGESHRVRIKELTSGVETKNETFIWCDGHLCQKRNGVSIVRNYFKQGFEEGTTDYFYTKDHLGSVREVIGTDGITVASRVSYDPWGKSTESGSGALSDFGFTGHYYDRATALNLAWYRGYDPNLGSWLSRDPIGLGGGVNLYGYANNDPTNYFDPDGHVAVAAAPAAAAAAGAALALWGAYDCAVNGCQGIKTLMDSLLGKPYCPTRDKAKEKEKKRKACQDKYEICQQSYPACADNAPAGNSTCGQCYDACVGGFVGEGCGQCGF